MITVVTGLPGAGKTLYVLCLVKEWAERDGRPVYYSGIKDLTLPWIPLDAPEKWFDVESRAIVVIDEAQRFFRPMGAGAVVPPHIAQLETHRHSGIDLILITQHPMLLHTHVRRLGGRHLHAVRRFGMARSTVHEWGEVKYEIQNREDSTRHKFGFPRAAFGWYKSAEAHTHKRSIPMWWWFMLSVPVLFAGGVWYFVHGMSKGLPSSGGERKGEVSGALLPGLRQSGAVVVGTQEFLVARVPRVVDLPESAPVYDGLTAPTSFPYVRGCLQSSTRCRCYSEQGTLLAVSLEACARFVAHGAFDHYRPRASIEPLVRLEAGGHGGIVPISARSPAATVDAPAVIPAPVPAEQPFVLQGGRAAQRPGRLDLSK